MKTGGILAIAAIVIVAIAAWYMVDVDQTQEARLPDVDVDVSGGQAPKFDAEVGSVAVGETEANVTVPKVEVTSEEKTFALPTLDVKSPEEERNEAAGQPASNTN